MMKIFWILRDCTGTPAESLILFIVNDLSWRHCRASTQASHQQVGRLLLEDATLFPTRLIFNREQRRRLETPTRLPIRSVKAFTLKFRETFSKLGAELQINTTLCIIKVAAP